MTNAHMQVKAPAKSTQDMEVERNISVKKNQKHQLDILRT